MAITRVQSKTAVANNSTPTLDIGSVPAAGDLLVVGIAIDNSARTISLPGFTLIPTDGAVTGVATNEHAVFYKIATGVAGTDVITGSLNLGARWRMLAVQYHSTPAGTWFLDKSAHNSGTGTTADSGSTASTSAATEVWVGVMCAQAAAGAFTLPTNGFVQVQGSATTKNAFLYERIVSTVGVAHYTVTSPPAVNWISTIATFYSQSPAVTVVAVAAQATAAGLVPIVHPLRPPAAAATASVRVTNLHISLPGRAAVAASTASIVAPVLKIRVHLPGAARATASVSAPVVLMDIFVVPPAAKAIARVSAPVFTIPFAMEVDSAAATASGVGPKVKFTLKPPAAEAEAASAAVLKSTALVVAAEATASSVEPALQLDPGIHHVVAAEATANGGVPTVFSTGLTPEQTRTLVLTPVGD